MSKSKLKKIKSGIVSRSFSLAKLSAKVASKTVLNRISDAITQSNTLNDLLEEHGKIISKELGELKGSLMKAGQMLSIYGEHFLPPNANQFLRTLQSNSPPVEFSSIKKMLNRYLSKEVLAQLEINPESHATASLGQVHLAQIKKSKDQTTLAMKIQYPDVDKAIDSDLKSLKTILSVLKLIPRELNLDPVLQEVRTMFTQEVNYELEADFTQTFYDKLKSNPNVIVPKVYKEFSSKKVLTTGFIEGYDVASPEVQSLPEERRARLAEIFLDLFFYELFVLNMTQSDPHAGNYKIVLDREYGNDRRNDGARINDDSNKVDNANSSGLVMAMDKIATLDFGATKVLAPQFISNYKALIRAALFHQDKALEESAYKLKFLLPDDPNGLKLSFKSFCYETIEPFISPDDIRNSSGLVLPDGRYDWGKSDLPSRIAKSGFKIVSQFHWRTPPPEIIFLNRKTGGVFIFVKLFNVKMNGRDILLRYLSD